MRFSSKEAFDRFVECREFAAEHHLLDKFNGLICKLLSWEKYDPDTGCLTQEAWISKDWDDKCFYFEIVTTDHQRTVMNGGIIYHGCPDDGYLKNGSYQLDPSYGWQIHT